MLTELSEKEGLKNIKYCTAAFRTDCCPLRIQRRIKCIFVQNKFVITNRKLIITNTRKIISIYLNNIYSTSFY